MIQSYITRSARILREEGVKRLFKKGASHISNMRIDTIYTKARYNPDHQVCDLMDEDWDNLVILDACRFDQFESINSFPGSLKAKISRGSSTPEFLDKNFREGTYKDTVYVTANPMYRTVGIQNTFHDVIDVWESRWDQENKTVLPRDMMEATKNAYKKYPKKRIISHFMQPHYPFIGGVSSTLKTQAGYEDAAAKAKGEQENNNTINIKSDKNVWEKLKIGEVSEGEVWRAYNKNLEIAMPYVENLVDYFDGKTIITSDHGNLLGDRIMPLRKPIYGHPPRLYVEELRKVPWMVIEDGNRREILTESSSVISDDELETVDKRLSDLGYADSP